MRAGAADVLTLARLLACTPLFLLLVPDGGWMPVAVFFAAAASDFFDGPLSRRPGATASRHGGVLDSTADIVFVLAATLQAAWLEQVSWIVPASIALSVGTYVAFSLRLSAGSGAPRLARSRIGHAAGIANYVLVGLCTGPGALPEVPWSALIVAGSAIVVALNLGAVLARLT